MASFDKTPPQTTASAVGLLRKLARDEQKKLAHLRAINGAADDIAAAETRVRDLTAKLSAAASAGGGAAARARQVGGDGGEVHVGAAMTEEELAAARRARPDEAPTGSCAACGAPTARACRTGRVSSFFCSAACQKRGWRAHLERARAADAAERARRRRDVKDAAAAACEAEQTRRRVEQQTAYDMDCLGVIRGGCATTDCPAYVQKRGAPRSVRPRARADGSIEDGVWAWNRVDHLVCARCGAPAGAHADVTQEVEARHRGRVASKPAARPRRSLGAAAVDAPVGRAGRAVQRGAAASDSSGSESDSDATVELAG